MSSRRAVVVTVSDRVSAGTTDDRSGPLAVELLVTQGFSVGPPVVVPDSAEAIADAVASAVASGVELVVTTGGTGLAPRDVTPEAVSPLLQRSVPGLADLVRRAGADRVPTAALSRGVAGVLDGALVITLPGSTGGVRDGLAALEPVLRHAIDQIRGVALDHDPPA